MMSAFSHPSLNSHQCVACYDTPRWLVTIIHYEQLLPESGYRHLGAEGRPDQICLRPHPVRELPARTRRSASRLALL